MAAIANLYTRLLGRDKPIDPVKEVLVTDGAYEALFTAIMGHVNPGDEVIIIEPYFDCYEPMVRLAGGTPVFISLKPVSRQISRLQISIMSVVLDGEGRGHLLWRLEAGQ